MKSVYKTPEGKRLILGLYDQMLKKLKFQFESMYINTRFGKTHLLIGGQKTSEPIITFQGGNSVNPLDLIEFESLTKKYRVYAPDTIGQPGKSDETRLSPKNDDYGKWAVDLLDDLGIKKANFIGMSFGGGILMRLAAYAPERISKAIFINPMAIGLGSMIKMIYKLVFPNISYIRHPSKKNLIHALEALVANKNEISEIMLENYGCIFQNSTIVDAPIKPPRKKELIKFTAPSMLIASENDIMFPANKIVPKAKKNISNLMKIRIIDKGSHIINERNMKEINEEIFKFLEN